MNDDKKITFGIHLGEEGETVFTFDMASGIGADGKLSESGRADLKRQMVAAFGPKMQPHDVPKLEAAVEELLKGGGSADTMLTISGKSIVTLLDRMLGRLEDLPTGARALARGLSQERPITCAPHVFALGEAAAMLAAAHSMLTGARSLIDHVIACERGLMPTGDEPEKNTTHTPKGGLWS